MDIERDGNGVSGALHGGFAHPRGGRPATRQGPVRHRPTILAAVVHHAAMAARPAFTPSIHPRAWAPLAALAVGAAIPAVRPLVLAGLAVGAGAVIARARARTRMAGDGSPRSRPRSGLDGQASW